MKVIVYQHDPMLELIYLPDEAKEMFGEDYLDDYGVEIPDELVKELTETYTKLKALCDQLRKVNPDRKKRL